MFDNPQIMTWNAFSGAFHPITADILRETYMLPIPTPNDLSGALLNGTWPWSKSLESAPAETTTAVSKAFRQFVEATDTLRPEGVNLSSLAPKSRVKTHASALLDLWQSIKGALPPDLTVWRGVLEASANSAIAPLPIVTNAPSSRASPAYRALYDKLVFDHGRAPALAQAEWVSRQHPLTKGAAPDTSLGHVQRQMLVQSADRRPLDDSLQFLSLRDYAEQADCAAALVQEGLAQDPATNEHDFGLLIPDDPVLAVHLQRAFSVRGIALSGLPAVHSAVDVAGETLLDFLLSLRRPAPSMALASLYVSPLMPWDCETGHAMAGEVMGGWFNYRGAADFPRKTEQFYRLLRQSDVTVNRTLGQLLKTLGEVVRRDSECWDAARQLDALINRLRTFLAMATEAKPDWDTLIDLAAPQSVQPPRQARFSDGVPVFTEPALPWRPVQHLIVLGFAAGSYPRSAGGNPFFLDSECLVLRDKAGLFIPTRAEILDARFKLFQEQICAASNRVTFLCPERDGAGMVQGRPTSLALIARTIEGVRDYETLPVPLEQGLDVGSLFPTRQIKSRSSAGQLPQIFTRTIELQRDLLALRKTDKGVMLRQTPSRLETLLVSPLVWVLNELGAEPSVWAPEDFNIMLRGTLAHDVLENLFLPGKELPTPADIPDAVLRLCDQAIRQLAPFLQSSLWKVERQRFVSEVTKAALAWRKNLLALEAEIVVNEARLSGEAHGILINGRADCILRLKNGQLLIIDHKKSSSGNRRERMLAGWDLQLGLYRDMLLRPDFRNKELQGLLVDQADIAVAYHTMNDSAVLSHGLFQDATGTIESIEHNISEHALGLLKSRLAEVGAGTVSLNTDDDEGYFKKTAKITPYALTSSFLAGIFTVPPQPKSPLE